MVRYLLLVIVLLSAQWTFAQRVTLNSKPKQQPLLPVKTELTIPDLQKLMEYDNFRIDTTMKKKGYLLMQKDVDSATSLYQYSFLEHNTEKPSTVRSLQYMDVNTSKYSSRLLTYRTYDKDEYKDLSIYLLNNNYRSTDKYTFQGAENIVYSNGTQTIRVKIFVTPMPDGRRFTAWELEFGK
ncbi:hypothetical protein HHL16_07845 [Pseudoflavitalea sp. G-6-1-2]|uniref:hypothetical protein n=1 Tax=Pseudoflavitalea sp. G-6-1-2 TaxID=2728841 RepID=UPI00146C14D8|nr:hypothetical protein [Pseudoflavitalea sp. G-6-1-2]NML20782.1 hypothetical protein [Pseudoflavitalea sp. G-6-1-2]